jgi:hypothetical protein
MGTERSGGWRPWSAPAVQAGLGLLELALVRLAGPPGRQLGVLRQLGEVDADPLASLLALLALLAEGLAAYLLVVLGLRLLALLPGILGRMAAGAALRLAPAAVRRTLDLLLGGALLAQSTLTPLAAGAAAAPPPVATSSTTPAAAARSPAPLPPWLADRPPTPASALPTRPAPPASAPVGQGAAAVAGPAGAGAPPASQPARSGAAPAPGQGGSRRAGAGAAGGTGGARPDGAHTVRRGDTLWGIAAAHLRPAARSAAAIDRYWRQVYRANRARVGPDPDLIHPGTRLLVPPERPDRR